jgi:hypothetical protein
MYLWYLADVIMAWYLVKYGENLSLPFNNVYERDEQKHFQIT